MQVSTSDDCKRTILSPVSIFAKGQINEECLLDNVESWESWSLADAWDLLLARTLVADAAVWRLPGNLSLPRIMLPVPVRSQTELSIKQLLPSSMSGQCYHLKGHSCSNPVDIHHQWGMRAHLQVSSSDHSERTTLFAVSIFKMSGQWRVSPSQCWKLRKLKFPDFWDLEPSVTTTKLHLCWEESLVADAAVLRLPEILTLLGIMVPVPVRARLSAALDKFCHVRRTSTSPSLMFCQSCQFMTYSCGNLVHINRQKGTESTHGGVSQWQLQENRSLHSFYFRKGSDQRRVCPSQCWKLRKLEFGKHLRPCAGKSLGCWCCYVTASRNPVVARNHVVVLVPSKNEQSIEQILACWKNKH